MYEDKYFNIAKEVSEMSNHRCRLGCVVVDHHRIISSGYNSATKCHRIQKELDRKYFPQQECSGPVHAEMSALIPLVKRRVDLTGATIFVYRQKKDGTVAMARPCPRCMEYIRRCGIKHIKYSTDDGFASERVV